jgi:hypothetical protein
MSLFGPAELVICAEPEAGLRLTAEGRVGAGADAPSLDAVLRDENACLRRLFGEPLPPYFHVAPVNGEPLDLPRLAEQLRGHDAVRAAYVRPVTMLTVLPAAEVARHDAAPITTSPQAIPTSDLSAQQRYLLPADEGGVDAPVAWALPGGRGAGVSIVDIEQEWRFSHEDLQFGPGGLLGGKPKIDGEARNHGTNVLGILGARHDGSGVMGLCPEAAIRGMSIWGQGVAAAIWTAAEQLEAGDILLIELMARGPNTPPGDDETQLGYLPIERWPAEFEAIRNAVDRGIVVVAAAGNGSQDLDAKDAGEIGFPEDWVSPLTPGGPDSGAILVGAGAPPPGTHERDHGPDRTRLAFSNYGSRVDVQAWGREVTTTGGIEDHADELWPAPEEDRWYTNRFAGTSSAAPIVAGALACVQGILRERGVAPLTSEQARELLWESGAPQAGEASKERIGNRPDLAELIDRAIRITRPRTRRAGMRVEITITEGDGVVVKKKPGDDTSPGGVEPTGVKGPTITYEDEDGKSVTVPLAEKLDAAGIKKLLDQYEAK